MTIAVRDEKGDSLELEFLGLVLLDGRSYGFFFPVDEQNAALSSGEVMLLEVVETDDDGQPSGFELVEDEAVAGEVYEEFKRATKDLYRFE